MDTICLVPIKNLETVKSRLSSNFSIDRRRKIFMHMVSKTIRTVNKSTIEECWILSSDTEITKFANDNGITRFPDCPNGLNSTLKYYANKVFDLGANAMYLAPDLPLIDNDSLSKLIETFDQNGTILVPDLAKTGINAIIWEHKKLLGPFLGINSYNIHIQQAKLQNIKVTIFENEQLQYDLDTVEHFNNLPDFIRYKLMSL